MKMHKHQNQDGENQRGMVPLRDMMGRLFEESFLFPSFTDSFFSDPFFNQGIGHSLNSVKVDIEETEKNFIFTAELPGVDPNKIDLDLTETALTISVEMGDEKEEKGKNYIRRESSHGKIQRSFDFRHAPIVVNDSKADFKNGILKITLPKEEKEKKKGIKIPINS